MLRAPYKLKIRELEKQITRIEMEKEILKKLRRYQHNSGLPPNKVEAKHNLVSLYRGQFYLTITPSGVNL